MSTSFENLRVYQAAEKLADLVWEIVARWEPLARDTVGRQLIRAADSIGANIAEGYGRQTYVDNRRFVETNDQMTNNVPSLIDLALTFNKIAIASFGGGLSAWSREVVVVERRWMTEEEFLSALTICRILPGANQVNLAVFVGVKFHGVAGAVAATFGLTLVPVLIVLGMGWFYFTYSKVPAMKSILHGMTAAAVAMTFAMAIKTGRKCLQSPVGIALFVVMFGLSALLRMPLIAALALCGPVALWWAWPRKPKTMA